MGLLANRLQRLDMVAVSMGGEDVTDAQSLELLDDARRVVGGVDQQRLPALRIAEQVDRSEEHTSELQSHLNLVCRLLLEKKNILRPLERSCHSWVCNYT